MSGYNLNVITASKWLCVLFYKSRIYKDWFLQIRHFLVMSKVQFNLLKLIVLTFYLTNILAFAVYVNTLI